MRRSEQTRLGVHSIRGVTMRRTAKLMIGTAGVGLALATFGFFMFAGVVMRDPDATAAISADGIVVLTGAEFRIAEGARLLQAKRGKRLLISGVHPRVTRADLVRITGLPTADLDCCVDVDTKALDTVGNAAETQGWIDRHGYESLILVTSNYHMPRSLAEFSRVMPRVRIEPHVVVPKSFPEQAWWLHPGTARILLSEYLKYLPAAARLAASRALGAWRSSSLTAGGNDRPPLARL